VGGASLSSAGPLSPASDAQGAASSDTAGMRSPAAVSGHGSVRGSGGGSGSMFRATLLLCTVMMAAMSTVIAVSCTVDDGEPIAAIVIYIPGAIQLGQLLFVS